MNSGGRGLKRRPGSPSVTVRGDCRSILRIESVRRRKVLQLFLRCRRMNLLQAYELVEPGSVSETEWTIKHRQIKSSRGGAF